MIKAFLLSLLFVSVSYAGDAGCGLGGALIKSNTRLPQMTASTLNWSSATQLFGITFGTSGCTASGIVKNDKQIQYFVEVNQEELTREIAQGYGEKVSTLAALNGCMSQEQISMFNARAQASFQKIVPTAKTTAIDFVSNLKSSAIADACSGS